MEQFQIVLGQIVIFMIITVIGFIAVKAKVLNNDGLTVVTKLFTKITLPFMLFTNTVNGTTRAEIFDNMYIVLISLGTYVVLIAVSWLLVKLLRLRGDRGRLFALANTFGNVGFIGIPLLLALFGQKVMMYVAVFTVVDQVLIWTYGFALSCPSGTKMRFEVKTLKNMLNPPLVAVLLALVFVLLDLRLPTVVNDAFLTVAAASTPLPFIYIGGMIAICDMKKFVRYYELYVGVAVKMVIIPIIVFLVLRALKINDVLAMTTMLIVALPSIAITPMLARANGSDEEYATAAVIITTLLSLVTLSLVSYLASVVL